MNLIPMIDNMLAIDSAPEAWPIPVSKEMLREIRHQLSLIPTPPGDHTDFHGMTGTRHGFLED
jgi:hypothetical protein